MQNVLSFEQFQSATQKSFRLDMVLRLPAMYAQIFRKWKEKFEALSDFITKIREDPEQLLGPPGCQTYLKSTLVYKNRSPELIQ